MANKKTQYEVVGEGPYGVVRVLGNSSAMVYDLIENRAEADQICAALNRGRGPHWSAVSKVIGQELP